VVRAGFAAFLLLLLVSAWEAHRIQDNVSEQHLEIYRTYVQQEDLIEQIVQKVNRSGNVIRESFIDPSKGREQACLDELASLSGEIKAYLDELDHIQPGVDHLPLRKKVDEYFAFLRNAAHNDYDRAAAFAFVRREMAPRRSMMLKALNGAMDVSQDAVQNSEGEFTTSRQAAMKRLLLMLGICMLLGLLAATFSLRHAESLEQEAARQYREVTVAKKNLEQLSGRLLEIQEEERRSLSRELHDEIGQTLTALRIEVSRARGLAADPEVEVRLDRARTLAEQTVQSIRNISLLLRPSLLDDLGLVPALQWQLENFSKRSGIECEFQEQNVPEELPDNMKTCVYRVAQEALHNCEKHSGASRIRLTVRRSGDVLKLEVHDNGRGFDIDANGRPRSGSGLGVLGMEERAIRAGGTIRITSSKGNGTLVVLAMPLAAIAAPVMAS
jgi:signal transduction histidine kinase